MDIAVLGTGMVGRALAARLVGLGHTVVMSNRVPEATLAKSEPDPIGVIFLQTHKILNPGDSLSACKLFRIFAANPGDRA